MTKPKNQLQAELKEKVKPSDLKEDEGYISDTQPNKSWNNKNQSEQQKNNLSLKKDRQIQQLERERNFEATKAQNYLTEITKLTAELDSANLEIKELSKKKPTKTQQELEKALIEANQKIRDQEKEISTYKKNNSILLEQNKSLIEKKNPEETTRENKEPTNKTFFCDGCQLTKQGNYIKKKIDSPFEPRLHGRTCYLCSACSPYYKELNDTTFDKENNPYKLY